MTAVKIARSFLVLRATRWLPTGLLIPVLILLLLDRGFSLGEVGLAFAAQGLVVFLLELPTGGLADSLGRRPVLMLATLVDAASLAVLLVVDSVAILAIVFTLQGIYRALESGPLDAWFVDETQRTNPEADIGQVLARAGSAVGLAIAAGALLSAGLVALDPIDGYSPFVAPILVAITLRCFDFGAIALLMTEDRTPPGLRAVVDSVQQVPSLITGTLNMVRASTALGALVAVEFVWGFGMTSFESLTPPKLAETTGSVTSAASLFGPLVTLAWIASAAGAAIPPRLSSRIGPVHTAMAMHLAQALMVIGLAISANTVAAAIFYILTMTTHGAANPAYQTLLHQQANATHRATIVSVASMAGHPGSALGGIALGLLADQTSVSTAMLTGAIALAATIPLYIPVKRRPANNLRHRT